MLEEIVNRNNILRKMYDYSLQLKKLHIKSMINKEAYFKNSPILVNSFPKSGTHLLYQVLKSIPSVKSYGTFITSMPALPHKKVNNSKINKKIQSLIPGEVARGHIFYEELYAESLSTMNVSNYFIYRDLRDVVISEAHYLTNMLRWHSLHPIFKNLKNKEQRILFAITGDFENKTGIYYPNIAERFNHYKFWIDDESTLAIRFEDLIGDNQYNKIKEIIKHYLKHSTIDIDPAILTTWAQNHILPEKSHTYRKGKKRKWKETLSERHLDIFNQIAGELNRDIGYSD